MKKQSIVAIAVASVLASAAASAVSLDFRLEQRAKVEDKADAYRSRVMMSGSVGSHALSVEMKQYGNPLGDWKRDDNEFAYKYNWNVNKKWRVQPGIPITFGSTNTTLKPQVQVRYKFDSGLQASLRYRHQFRICADDQACVSDRDGGDSHKNASSSKFTAVLAYNFDALQFTWESNYDQDFSGDWKKGNRDGKYEWETDLKIGYREKGWDWRPYVQFGSIQCNSSCDDSTDRQLRTRLGVTYYF